MGVTELGEKKNQIIWCIWDNYSFPSLFHRVETSHIFAAKDVAGKAEVKLQVEA